MAINFPTMPEVQLLKPPLSEVICQVRFPLILRINKEEPSEFQDKIRNDFPKVEIEQGFLFPFHDPRDKESGSEAQTKITYRFLKMDGKTVVSLSSDFYALSTKLYTHWDEFSRMLSNVNQAVMEIYSPAYGTRFGLRFINRLTLDNTGAQDTGEMLDLLNPYLISYTRQDCWSDPLEMESRLLLQEGDIRLTIRYLHSKDKDDKPVLLVDLDCYEEGELPFDNMVSRIGNYHDLIYRAFRWCITDASLNKFEPKFKGT